MRQLTITHKITTRDSIALKHYLQEIAQIETISADEEVKLALLIKSGDQKALEKLVNSNLKFVVSVAKQYPSTNLSLSDLINEGNLGLIKAAKLFDETKGFKFISYAVWWIRQSIITALNDKSRSIRLPCNQINTHNKITQAYNALEIKLSRVPSVDEVADFIDLPQDVIVDFFRHTTRKVSIDAPLNNQENSNTTIDIIYKNTYSEEYYANESLKEDLLNTLSCLTEREHTVISMHFGLETDMTYNLESIGTELGIKKERVRQIKKIALKKLSLHKSLKAYNIR